MPSLMISADNPWPVPPRALQKWQCSDGAMRSLQPTHKLHHSAAAMLPLQRLRTMQRSITSHAVTAWLSTALSGRRSSRTRRILDASDAHPPIVSRTPHRSNARHGGNAWAKVNKAAGRKRPGPG